MTIKPTQYDQYQYGCQTEEPQLPNHRTRLFPTGLEQSEAMENDETRQSDRENG